MTVSAAVDPSARASVTGILPVFQNTGLRGAFLPQRIAVIGQGATALTYSTTKQQVTSAFDVGTAYGFGTPLHLAVVQLLPEFGNGVGSIPVTVYPLEDAGTGVVAAGDITPGGLPSVAASYRVIINNIASNEFVISVGDSVADVTAAMTTAINGVLGMPVVAVDASTTVEIEAKWKGASGNDLYIAIEGSTTAGNTFAITQPVGGLINPDVQVALDQFGEVWETLVINCLEKTDTATLDKYTTFGEARWNPLVKKPLIVFSGDVNSTVALATVIPEARKTEWINSQLVSPDSKDLPLVVAAAELVQVAIQAEFNPPTGYGGRQAPTLTPALDSAQWDYGERDEAVKKGSSTITIEDGVVTLGNIVTFYHPDGQEFPAYANVVDIIKLQNIIYGLDTEFEDIKWRDAPLIPNSTPTKNPNAKTPAMARAEVAGLIDFWADWALISDPKEAKAKTTAEISALNPNRIDMTITVTLAGTTNVKAITLFFNFFAGGQ